ncbi:protein FAR1-RELATED SEQUENCE 6-like [Cornus florida]|uniref:protein FAR1-RELATED SEQUENCE 6-like n=1 Tax=Cornus florida TaxID=4283 RepID=UPI00289B85D5|nr:protein FAR1-RELATED SEQUENCE 6-like [Cornus florida]
MVRNIRFNNVHTHTAQDISDYKPIFHSKEMGRVIVNKVRDNPSYKPNVIYSDLESEFSVNMTYKQAWRAKERANQIIERCPKDSYILVPWLCQRISEAIPGTFTSWECTDDMRFKRVFVAYGCSIRGFNNYCRPILSIDDCHLSGNYKGTMLGATGYDANHGLWPLAYGIVSSENDDDWHWFLNLLKHILDGRSVTILTDRHPSLKKCVRDILALNTTHGVFGII